MSHTSSALVFKYHLDGHDIEFEANVTLARDNDIMIQYDVNLDGVYVMSLKNRTIKDSSHESSFRMRVAASIFTGLQKMCSEQGKHKQKCVSFAKHKTVQDYCVCDTQRVFFSDMEGHFVGKKYDVPLDMKILHRD